MLFRSKGWIDEIYERCAARTQKKDTAELAKLGRKLMRNKVPKLLDANGRNRQHCILIITEGDSAKGMISAVRDPEVHGALPLRGKILNVTQLAWNPTKPERDTLYSNGVNPVIQLKGVGTVLFGDKTLTDKPSAFDRINVRRLFIVLEKAIANAAKYSLFEFNDEFTRAQFVSLVEPFLRDVKGKRGIYDFKVVCDETNNTPDVIDRNEFRGDIYIKPARAINFIHLNFVAVQTGVAFSEIVGKL